MVLIIDDEADIRWVLQEVLAAEGIESRAVGPLEAIPALCALTPEVILLDLCMPGVSGYDMLRFVRAHHGLCHAFVLIVTALNGTRDIKAGLDCGADDYLTKPFDPEELVARVARGLSEADRARLQVPPPVLAGGA